MSSKNFQSCPQQIIAATRHFNGSHVYEEESFESSKSINIKKHVFEDNPTRMNLKTKSSNDSMKTFCLSSAKY